MSAATPITWTEHSADELHELAGHCGEPFRHRADPGVSLYRFI